MDPAEIVTATQGWGQERALSEMQKRAEGEEVDIYNFFENR